MPSRWSLAPVFAAWVLCVGSAGCAASRSSTPGAQSGGQTAEAAHTAHRAHTEEGLASWYGPELAKGTPTASGERYRDAGYTAAHRTLPFGTRVLVESLRNHKRVVVRVTDRGPFSGKRIIDLSGAAARALDMVDAGVIPVRLIVIP